MKNWKYRNLKNIRKIGKYQKHWEYKSLENMKDANRNKRGSIVGGGYKPAKFLFSY